MKRLLSLFTLILLFNITAIGGNADKEKTTTKIVAGRVTDTYGESLPGAKITILETGETFFADLEGNYRITLKTDKEYSIALNTMGYEPVELKSSALNRYSDLSLKSLN